MASPRAKRRRSAKTPRLVAFRRLRDTPHRYTWIRWLTLSLTMVVLYAVPLSGLAHADLVRGRHMAAFEPAGWILPSILAMVTVALAFWAMTIVLTAMLGRVFCGFGCLVGQSARLGDNTASAELTGKRRGRAWLAQVGVSALFAGGISLWWLDPTVLVDGTPGEMLTAGGIVAVVLAAVLAHGRWWRWGFCKQLCPIGLYYSVVGQGYRFGVVFDPADCNDCNLCDKACPVGLTPRSLDEPFEAAEGVGFSGLPSRNHCLVCGDCVRACEISMRKADASALRLGFDVAASAVVRPGRGDDSGAVLPAPPPAVPPAPPPATPPATPRRQQSDGRRRERPAA